MCNIHIDSCSLYQKLLTESESLQDDGHPFYDKYDLCWLT